MKNKLKIGMVGLGSRGSWLLNFDLLKMDDIIISAVCDRYEDRRNQAADAVLKARGLRPAVYGDYKDLLSLPSLDAILVTTSWADHVCVALDAMRAGIPVGFEVGGAYSIEQCWELIRTQEQTGTPCMMLENCCYDREFMMILHMVRQGVFGEIIHCQGGYEHDLRREIALGIQNRHYRYANYLNRNAELYPTHELGPISKLLNIHRGNRFLSLTSMSSKSKGLESWILQNQPENESLPQEAFMQGDITTTMIKCARGETVLLTHDTTLPRPYSRGGRVQGTKGIWMELNHSVHLEGRSKSEEWEPSDRYRDAFEHPLWRGYLQNGVRQSGHGGVDYLVLRAFFENIIEKRPLPISITESAAWMAVTCLSEQSIALGSQPVAFPDFTEGRWITDRGGGESLYALDI